MAHVGLEKGDQRLFLIEETGRAGGRVDGKLHCGFCRAAGEQRYWLPVWWYPEHPQQDVAPKAVLQHFRNCPHRGRVTTFPVAVFAGQQDKVGTAITIAIV